MRLTVVVPGLFAIDIIAAQVVVVAAQVAVHTVVHIAHFLNAGRTKKKWRRKKKDTVKKEDGKVGRFKTRRPGDSN